MSISLEVNNMIEAELISEKVKEVIKHEHHASFTARTTEPIASNIDLIATRADRLPPNSNG